MKKQIGFVVLVCLLGALNVHAQATRTWVSGVGDDANPCSRTAPCKTFAGAISKTAAGGEIDVLDPGGFGTLTVTKSITIDGHPFQAGALASGGIPGFTINATSNDVVTLRHLSIVGVSGATNGVRVLNAKAVHIENCVITGFTRGIDFEPSAAGTALFVSDSEIRGNDPTNLAGGGGILIKSLGGVSVSATLDNVRMERNNFGLRVEDGGKVNARDSVASGNANAGVVVVSAGSAPTDLTLDSCTTANNTIGVKADVTAGLQLVTVRLSRSTVTGNGTGLLATNGAHITTQVTNWVQGNSTNGSFTDTANQQ